jgi:hypothetical protein
MPQCTPTQHDNLKNLYIQKKRLFKINWYVGRVYKVLQLFYLRDLNITWDQLVDAEEHCTDYYWA